LGQKDVIALNGSTVEIPALNIIAHKLPINYCTFSNDGKYIFSASDDKTVKIFEVGQKYKEKGIIQHSDAVISCNISPDGCRLLSQLKDKTIMLWDVTKNFEIENVIENVECASQCSDKLAVFSQIIGQHRVLNIYNFILINKDSSPQIPPLQMYYYLRISIIAGIDLMAADMTGKSDPYVIAKMGSHIWYKTKIIIQDLNPVWNETFQTIVLYPLIDKIQLDFEVWDWDRITVDDFLGRTSYIFHTDDWKLNEKKKMTLKLEDTKSGSITLELELHS